MFEGGYRYSVKNCLYEGALQKIISNCSCLPPFVEYNVQGLDICVAEKLYCALGWMNNMGSSINPDLTSVLSKNNKTQKCLQVRLIDKSSIQKSSLTYLCISNFS
jgi:hypothetical protein